ncbi:50S ribosomal protein L18 [Patescibacteria group bacterium]|nr:50S ribosomal protein L18 [Patescibacteria group bacterium]
MKDLNKIKYNIKLRRQARTRSKLHGTAKRPRVTIKRSLRFMAAQAINDDNNQTIVGLHESKLKLKGDKTKRAEEFGKLFAKALTDKKIETIIFDRGAYKYHGRVKAFAEALRANGLKF